MQRDETPDERAAREQFEKQPTPIDNPEPSGSPSAEDKERVALAFDLQQLRDAPRSPYQHRFRGRGSRHLGEGLAAMMNRLARRSA